MRVVALEIRNYRCLCEVRIDCDPLTVLAGPNGSGKSSLLRALEFLFRQREVDDLDCWGRDRELLIEVSATFADLPDPWPERLAPWLDSDAQLTIKRESTPTDAGRTSRYVSFREQVPDFRVVREQQWGSVGRVQYAELRTQTRFADLPGVSTQREAFGALDQWELQHPADLDRQPDSSLSIGGGGSLDLGSIIELVTVPAVYDAAAEALEGATGNLRRLSNLLIRPRLAMDEPVRDLVEETTGKLEAIVHEQGEGVLREVEEVLTDRLRRLAPGAGVHLDWDYRPPTVDMPKVRAELIEAGFATEIGRQGHGVQRAYLFAILGALVELQTGEHASDVSLILAIEEPELYQHPVRARFLSGVLSDLASGGGPLPTQVLYTTHSPYFISLDRAESLRLLRIVEGSAPPQTATARVDLEQAAEKLWNAAGATGTRFTAQTLRPRLRPMIDTPVSEGFFAEVAVLVEGEEDRAMLVGAASAQGLNLTEQGIAVLAVGGKASLDRPLLIFKQLGIPTYVLFDGDASRKDDPKRSDPKSNLRLLRLLGGPVEEFPETRISDEWAVFQDRLGATVRSGIGEQDFDEVLEAACANLGFSKDRGNKNAVVLADIFRRLSEAGKRSSELDDILAKISALRRS